jgi:hypothetical protein
MPSTWTSGVPFKCFVHDNSGNGVGNVTVTVLTATHQVALERDLEVLSC